MSSHPNPKSGFTLIELLVVISIIGLLAAVVLVSLNGARAKSRDAKRVSDVHQIMTALELYYSDNSGYPPASGTGQAAVPAAGSGNPKFSTYLQIYPTYPTPIDGSSCASYTGYAYTQLSSGADYSLTFCVGGKVGTMNAGVHTASPSGIQ